MWTAAINIARWVGPYVAAALITASAAWWQTDTYWRGEYAALERDQAQALTAAQGRALAAKAAAEADIATAEARAAGAALALATEQSKLATALHQKLAEVTDVSLKACLALPLPRSMLDALPH